MEFDGEIFEAMPPKRLKPSKKRQHESHDGSEADMPDAFESGRKPGPRSFQGLAEWPKQVYEDIETASPDLLEVLRSNLCSNKDVWLTTHYSGMGCAELALLMLKAQLPERDAGHAGKVMLYSACDNDPLARKMLMERSKALAPRHVFGDITSRVPLEALAKLREIEASALDRAAESGSRWKCTDTEGKETLKQHKLELGENMVRDMCCILSQCKLMQKDFCFACNKMCPLLPDMAGENANAVHGEIAGTTCVAWSSMRSGASTTGQWLHKSTLPCLVWMFWLRQSKPTWYVHECTSRFDAQELCEFLEAQYMSFSLRFSPKMFGVPADRQRCYTVGFNTQTHQLTQLGREMLEQACADSLDEGQQLEGLSFRNLSKGMSECFREIFERQVAVGCEVFLQAPAEMIAAFHEKHAPPGSATCTGSRKDLLLCLSGAEFQRLLSFKKVFHDNFHGTFDEALGASGAVNLQQTIAFQARVTNIVPALLTQSVLCVLTKKGQDAEPVRVVLPMEHFGMLGFPIFGAGCFSELFPWEFSWLEAHLTSVDIRRMTGNGMHLQSVGSILGLLLSLFEPKSPFSMLLGRSNPFLQS
ncbi:unnamed protein product [Symbiodinium sp. CCMP2592]|nr:unnamed protein product [Symbiodinium sp. CCMP2592]